MKTELLTLTLALASVAGSAAESPRWLRNTAISPDGTTVLFTYKGDIFSVPSIGGDARQLTSSHAYDTAPVWSPDGSRIAFSSTREGGTDIFLMPAAGGTPRRITTARGVETPLAFLNDSTLIYSTGEIASRESTRFPTSLTRTYSVNVNRGSARPELYLSMPMRSASADASGRVLYADRKGFENEYRKHERSSATADIWLTENGKFRRLTTFDGHDLSPVWAPGNDRFYYLSEQDGTLNVYAGSLDGAAPCALTKFERNPVRTLSVSRDGLMAFSQDGDIYTLREGAQPSKLEIRITADQYDGDRVKRFVNAGASTMAVSPDGKELAFVLRGDVYVTDVEYKTTRRITDTPAQERMVDFSPDGRTLVYDSDRDGQWQLFTAEIKNPSEKRFAYATEIVEKPLYKGTGVAQQPAFSPDGTKVAFLEDRTTLRVVDVKTKKAVTALDGKYNYSYSDGDVPFEWSPDSEWLLISYIGNGGWNNPDIALVKADGTACRDLTESGYSDSNARWALGGKAMTYATAKYGMKAHGSWGNQDDLVLMAFDQEAWDDMHATEEEAKMKEEQEKEKNEEAEAAKKDKKKGKKDTEADKKNAKKLDLDLDNRRHRMMRLTESSAIISDYWLTPKGDKLYYIAQQPSGNAALMERDIRKGSTKALIEDVDGGLEADAKGENLFLISSEGMKKVNVADGSVKDIEFDAPYDRVPSLEREYIYDHMLRQVADKFYDTDLHGVDWEYYGSHYREFLPHIANNQDFSILLSEILGELNASHTGSGYRAAGPQLAAAELGAFFDRDYRGDGLKVTEVIAGSPLSAKKCNIRPGDVVMAVNGKRIEAGKDYYPLLEGLAGRKTLLEIKRASGKTDTVSMRPISGADLNELLYRRWVENNERFVDSISGGRVAYVHVEGMDTPSFNEVYDRLLGKYRNCDAVVVDTRWNGGGWLHNDIALLLSGKEYVRFTPRGQYIGSEPFSQWTKPSVMLVNESNYSDANGTPFTYKTLGIGKLVGAPVPGTMTAVWWETQIDPTIYFGIPQVTCSSLDGTPLENHQLNPDITVYNDPADELSGHDAQLEKAVRALMAK